MEDLAFGGFLYKVDSYRMQTADGKGMIIDSPIKRLGILVFGIPHIGFRLRAREVFRLLQAKKGDKILDAGTGMGLYSLYATIKGFETMGVDIDQDRVENAGQLAKKLGLPTVFQKADLTSLPFAGESFDHVICCEVLEHIKDDQKALGEIARIVKPTGTVVLTVPNIVAGTLARKDAFSHERAGYTAEDLEKLASQSGLKIEVLLPYQCLFGNVAWDINEWSFRSSVITAILFYPLYALSFLDALIPSRLKTGYGWVVKLKKIPPQGTHY
jgi:SAM-dependent methyltransferase